MYRWRTLTEEQRRDTLADRLRNKRPWHRPPHFEPDGPQRYILTAACFEHRSVIGVSEERLRSFQSDLLSALAESNTDTHAWCILPNHYHLLVLVDELKDVLSALGKLHGRTSHHWNGEDDARGRQVWHGISDRAIRGERHYFATLNYIHHNPVEHDLVDTWQDWEFSSAHEFLADTDPAEAKRIWIDYPILDYGAKWDP